MRVPITIHRFTGIQGVRRAVHRRPGDLLQQLYGDASHQIVQLGRTRYRFELSRYKSGWLEGALVEVPFRHMTWRQQLLAIVRTFAALLPCTSGRQARLRHSLGQFTEAEGMRLAPRQGFLPAHDGLAWLCELCSRFRAFRNPNFDLPATLDFRDAPVSDVKILQLHLRDLPKALNFAQLEVVLEPLCSLALAPDLPERKWRDDMVASLCGNFAEGHPFDMAAAKRILKLAGGLSIGRICQRWIEDGAARFADELVAAVNPGALKRRAVPLAGAESTTGKGLHVIREALRDLAAILPGLDTHAATGILRRMYDTAALPQGDRISRFELLVIVRRAESKATCTEEAVSPRPTARVWGRRAVTPEDGHR